jgi:hypothetical protein
MGYQSNEKEIHVIVAHGGAFHALDPLQEILYVVCLLLSPVSLVPGTTQCLRGG